MSASPDISSLSSEMAVQGKEQSASLWQKNPQRMAWMILLTAFGVFVVLAISIPLAVGYTLRYASVPQTVQFTPTVGTILLYPPGSKEPIAITAPRNDIVEGSRIEAGHTTQGELGLTLSSDGQALGTVHLYPGTKLQLVRVRRPSFASSPEPYYVHLRVTEGRVRLFTSTSSSRSLRVVVETPHGEAQLDEGIYNFTVSAETTDVSVSSGSARLRHFDNEADVLIQPGFRSWMSADQSPTVPITSQRTFVVNGDFSQPLSETWEASVVAEQNVVPGKVELEEQDGRRVAHFIRRGEEQVHTEVAIRQQIDQDVNVYEALRLELYVKVDFQSLAGAGYVSTEFPMRVEISYTDIYGKDLEWGHGFYYKDPEPGWPLQNGDRIPPSAWYFYASPNLIKELSATRPARINSIRVYASGHNYEASVSGISLVAE